MGSPCELHLDEQEGLDLEAVAQAAIAEVERLERKYTRYRNDSLTAQINRRAGSPDGLELDPETAGLLDYAATAFTQSGGLFDPTSGILRRAWNFRSGRVPAPEELSPLLERVGWQKVRWERPRLTLPLPGMELDFGGFVKEYAADRVAALCRERGARHGLVDLGGDLAVLGPHRDGSPWRVGIRDPRAPERAVVSLALQAGGMATSGDYARCMIVDGRRYAHLLDPRSGWPVQGLTSASVAASHCLLAGTASTVAMLRGPKGPAWLADLGLPHLWIDGHGVLGGSLLGSAASRSVVAGRHDDELRGEACIAGP